MNNILYGIKRFIKNKNTVTILAIVACLVIIYFAYNMRIKKATEPQLIPYALVDLPPRTLVTEEMVGLRKVPGSVVTPNVITSKSLIINKYVSNKVQIPKDSLFYNDTLLTWDELPSSIYEDIANDEAIVALKVNLNDTYGNSIFEGNYIDLYFTGRDEDKKILVGKFIESIKVKAVTDEHFNNIFENIDSKAQPAYLIFTVKEDMHKLLKLATKLNIGKIYPIPRNAEYSKNPKPTRIASTYIVNLIKKSATSVGEEISSNSNVTIIDNNESQGEGK